MIKFPDGTGWRFIRAFPAGTTLYDVSAGQFNDVDAFIEALGGADALLFG